MTISVQIGNSIILESPKQSPEEVNALEERLVRSLFEIAQSYRQATMEHLRVAGHAYEVTALEHIPTTVTVKDMQNRDAMLFTLKQTLSFALEEKDASGQQSTSQTSHANYANH